MKVGLFFGSFNPIHQGHLIIANYLCETTDLQQVWFVISPQNPFKDKGGLLNPNDRLHLVQLAIEGNPNLKACDIEFRLPVPSYTIDTLIYLHEKYPDHQFSLLMGSDNLINLPKWKNGEKILNTYPIYVYNRNDQVAFPQGKQIHFPDVPLLNISATFIRQSIRQGISMQYFLPDPVWQYIRDYRLYK